MTNIWKSSNNFVFTDKYVELFDGRRYLAKEWILSVENTNTTETEGRLKAREIAIKLNTYESLEEEIAKLKAERAILIAGVSATQSLIECSDGVYGLHKNGEGAEWSTIQTGGHFEDWMSEHDSAYAIALEEERNNV